MSSESREHSAETNQNENKTFQNGKSIYIVLESPQNVRFANNYEMVQVHLKSVIYREKERIPSDLTQKVVTDEADDFDEQQPLRNGYWSGD